ncbi:hypothetical protein VTL71DRAFT_3373 [Oculimacula yallundae]|uniref:LRAT domain-containing protein n=1 Tax=Oculimacula yallundae TaxID=86028 RepID=A0ABR4C6Y2_9HELO
MYRHYVSRHLSFGDAASKFEQVASGKASKAPTKTYPALGHTGGRYLFEVLGDGPHISSVEDWRDRNRNSGAKQKIGLTGKPRSELAANAMLVWRDRFPKLYAVSNSNCQNFCRCFLNEILVSNGDRRISEEERDTWLELPHSLDELEVDTIGKVASAATVAFVTSHGHGIKGKMISGGLTGAALFTGHIVAKHFSKDQKYFQGQKLLPGLCLEDLREDIEYDLRQMERGKT